MKPRVLILGAYGQLARHTTATFLRETDAMKHQAEASVAAMRAVGLRRLIFVSSMGSYGEVPGERYRSVLDPYRDSAVVIEASDLEHTVLRPG